MKRAITIAVEGMHCDGCADRVKRVLEREGGVDAANVSYAAGEAVVTHNPDRVTPERLRQIIEAAGYGAQVRESA